MTALHLAAQGNNWQSVAVLVRCGAQVTSEDAEGRTPLHLALLYSCLASVKALLEFRQPLEQTDKNGRNLLHAAVKSGESDCVSTLLDHINRNSSDSASLVRLLASSCDHEGRTPVTLAAAFDSVHVMETFVNAGLDLRTMTAHQPSLFDVASPAILNLFSSMVSQDFVCNVQLLGAPLDSMPKWTIGTVSVGPSTTWPDFENSLITLIIDHWTSIDSVSPNVNESEDSNGETFSVNDDESTLGLDEASIDYFSIGNHFWKKGVGDSSNLPFAVLKEVSQKAIEVHLRPLSAVSYSCLVPIYLLENYLRLMDQSKCVVVYGAKDSGKRTLARCLAALWCKSFAEDSYSKLDLEKTTDESTTLLVSSIEESLRNGCVLVLERVPRDLWPALWSSLKRGAASSNSRGLGGGRVLATMDSWRRPSGQAENEVLWVQMRHDRQPLKRFLARALLRQEFSLIGQSLPAQSECGRVIGWINDCYGRLSDTLMSLGFSAVLRGPQLFAQNLVESKNPKDMMLGVQSVWNSILVPEIRAQVQTVWRGSPLYGESKAPHESKVSAMALHVIFQRVFVVGVRQSSWVSNEILDGFLCRKPRPPPRPKDLPLLSADPSSSAPRGGGLDSSPTTTKSPEWNEDNLAKILGLSPMGYA